MTPEENIEIVKKFNSDLGEGKPITEIQELSDEIEWCMCGDPTDPLVGIFRGKDQVNKLFATLGKISVPGQVVYKDHVAQNDKVVATGWEIYNFNEPETGNGRSVPYNFIQIYTINKEGKISKYEMMYTIALDGMFGYSPTS